MTVDQSTAPLLVTDRGGESRRPTVNSEINSRHVSLQQSDQQSVRQLWTVSGGINGRNINRGRPTRGSTVETSTRNGQRRDQQSTPQPGMVSSRTKQPERKLGIVKNRHVGQGWPTVGALLRIDRAAEPEQQKEQQSGRQSNLTMRFNSGI